MDAWLRDEGGIPPGRYRVSAIIEVAAHEAKDGRDAYRSSRGVGIPGGRRVAGLFNLGNCLLEPVENSDAKP
jgi:hypothetical protein